MWLLAMFLGSAAFGQAPLHKRWLRALYRGISVVLKNVCEVSVKHETSVRHVTPTIKSKKQAHTTCAQDGQQTQRKHMLEPLWSSDARHGVHVGPVSIVRCLASRAVHAPKPANGTCVSCCALCFCSRTSAGNGVFRFSSLSSNSSRNVQPRAGAQRRTVSWVKVARIHFGAPLSWEPLEVCVSRIWQPHLAVVSRPPRW